MGYFKLPDCRRHRSFRLRIVLMIIPPVITLVFRAGLPQKRYICILLGDKGRITVSGSCNAVRSRPVATEACAPPSLQFIEFAFESLAQRVLIIVLAVTESFFKSLFGGWFVVQLQVRQPEPVSGMRQQPSIFL